jgi:hypothetical protein
MTPYRPAVTHENPTFSSASIRSPRLSSRPSRRGSAFLIAIGVLGVLSIGLFLFSRANMAKRWSVYFGSHEARAEEVAESALGILVDKIIKPEMNDNKVLFTKAIAHPDKFFGNWFTQFRTPTVMATAQLDPVNAPAPAGDMAAGNDVELAVDPLNSTILKAIAYKPIRYARVYGGPNAPAPNDADSRPLILLDDTLTTMGGSTTVVVSGRIVKAFGILPKAAHEYPIGGISVDTSIVRGWVGDLFKNLMADDITFDLAQYIPDTPIIQVNLRGMVSGIRIWITVGVGPAFPMPVGELIAGFLDPFLDDIEEKVLGALDLTWRGVATTILGNSLQINIPIGQIIGGFRDGLLSKLPFNLDLLTGKLGWGVTVEKKGILELTAEVWYAPYFPNSGPVIKKKLVTEREFRTADVQPIAPDYTFFVANSKLPYEKEPPAGFQGNESIDFNAGAGGSLVLHNTPMPKEIWESIQGIGSLDWNTLNRKVQIPGLIRVNGTDTMKIRLSMFCPTRSGADILKGCEILALAPFWKYPDTHPLDKTPCADLHEGGDGKSHQIIPKLQLGLMYLVDGVPPLSYKKGGWDWPYYGETLLWLPVPIPEYSRTQLFGDFHLEVPLSLRVEGNLWKEYTHLRIQLYAPFIIWIPFPPPGFSIPILPVPYPVSQAQSFSEPYGFPNLPPWERGDDPAQLWDGNNPKNLPANLYSPTQYIKKAAYYYPTSADFLNDIPNRSRRVNGEDVLICDGVSVVCDHLDLPQLKVMGRGILCVMGDLSVSGNITRVQPPDEGDPQTFFSLIARNGYLANGKGVVPLTIEAACYADLGVQNATNQKLKIDGNLVVNRFSRADTVGLVEVKYRSPACRSSLLSLFRQFAKYDPTRYMVSISNKLNRFEFIKQAN